MMKYWKTSKYFNCHLIVTCKIDTISTIYLFVIYILRLTDGKRAAMSLIAQYIFSAQTEYLKDKILHTITFLNIEL